MLREVDMKEFKDILREKRKALELNQKELADELGVVMKKCITFLQHILVAEDLFQL